MYLKLDDKTYYYFGYTRGTLQVLSSDQKGFNEPIRNLKDDDRTLKVSRGQMPFTFLVSTERKKAMVLNRWLTRDKKGTEPEQQIEQEPEPDSELEPIPLNSEKSDSMKNTVKPIKEDNLNKK